METENRDNQTQRFCLTNYRKNLTTSTPIKFKIYVLVVNKKQKLTTPLFASSLPQFEIDALLINFDCQIDNLYSLVVLKKPF
jgi:hypothetical protein